MMKKWIGLLKSILFSFVVYMWFLGSSLLIRIESDQMKADVGKVSLLRQRLSSPTGCDKNVSKLVENIDSHCALKRDTMRSKSADAEELVNLSATPGLLTKTKEERAAREKLLQLRREKTVRDNVIYVPDLEQFWCLVPKAASTSWSRKIIDALPQQDLKLQTDLRNESVPIQVVLRKHYGHIGTKKLNEIIKSKSIRKIVLARHPLSRIVSAFEDKLKYRKAKLDSMYFYGRYGVKIKKAFRKDRRLKRKEPSFEEFIDYLVQTNVEDYDEHWKPISLLCGICWINYNHIIKQEELENGMEFHLKKLGFIGTSGTKLGTDNKSLKEFQTIQEYFKNITDEKKSQLFHKYEDDFRLFQYGEDFI